MHAGMFDNREYVHAAVYRCVQIIGQQGMK